MQLLPLVEMYCKWELQEDCTNLRALMLRFDSESELESHELGRSLLSMIRDEVDCHDHFPLRATLPPQSSPFDLVRERLAAAGLAIRNLHVQVQLVLAPPFDFNSAGPCGLRLNMSLLILKCVKRSKNCYVYVVPLNTIMLHIAIQIWYQSPLILSV